MTDQRLPDRMFQHILDVEGTRYSNDPEDAGGPTKFGITQTDLENHRGTPVTPQDVEDMTDEEAREIYEKEYWIAPKLYLVTNSNIQLVLFDQCVNRGVATAIKNAQDVVNLMGYKPVLAVDGKLGPKTAAALDSLGRSFLVEFIADAQDHYVSIVIAKPAKIKFLKGWLNRTQDIMREVLA